ncbi:GntR family transcriptional regulator [Jannaschia sp. 2305UL9-9]|uniref:GntR family transcriptional regulator n=1 Tax=Jannaschia sp. 2305UL9-9 TaxID=3121638 RepID=UPI003529BEAA
MDGQQPQDTHADRVTRALEKMIFDGAYGDGDRLDEVQLAQQFGVSRTPVREAFQRLSQSGLVEQLPRRGVFVREPGPVELMEMFEVMAELEATCARLAAGRITDAALTALRSANDACHASVEASDSDGYYAHNETFHHLIYEQSGNAFLASETARLHRRLQPFRRMQLRLRGRLAQSMDEHEQIVAALSAGDATTASNVMRGHVAVQGEKFRHLIGSRRRAR